MQTLAQRIKQKSKTPYQMLAQKHEVTYQYICDIASGARNPQRGKGLLIKQDLEKIANQ